MPRRPKKLPETMTIGELHQMLEDLVNAGHAHEPIYFAYNYGDYSRTQAIGEINSIEPLPLEETPYSHSGWAIDEEESNMGWDLETEKELEMSKVDPGQPYAFIIREV